MVTSSNREKMLKHYMHTNDFELDHHRDITYPAVEPHYHEFYELLYFISGHVDYIIGDEIYHLQNDDLLIIPPNVMHNPIFADFRVPYERYVLWISLPTLQQLASIDEDLNYFLTAKGMKTTYSDDIPLPGQLPNHLHLLRRSPRRTEAPKTCPGQSLHSASAGGI